jgi:hypothetical protein
VIIAPIGFVRRVLGHDALKARQTGDGFWVPRNSGPERSDMKHQF